MGVPRFPRTKKPEIEIETDRERLVQGFLVKWGEGLPVSESSEADSFSARRRTAKRGKSRMTRGAGQGNNSARKGCHGPKGLDRGGAVRTAEGEGGLSEVAGQSESGGETPSPPSPKRPRKS